ncbi:MAG TPA: metallophosphoesterase [Candidatus Saccharimonadales bacterium]|nr:metallophosphoesterase [Candidatus Saccharimonadales bacterium]
MENTTGSESSDLHVSRRRIGSFVAVVLPVLLAATWFVCATWNHFWKRPATTPWEIIPSVLTVLFIVTTFLRMRHSNLGLRLAYRVSAIWLGVLNFSFFASCAAWIFSGATALVSIHVPPKTIALLFFGGAILASFYGWLNASWLRVTRVTVKLANLPEAWSGVSVALVTDLHLGNFRSAGFAGRVVAKLQGLSPQAILISGDLYDGSKVDCDALIAPWRRISALEGIYFVTGNHEEFTDRAKFLKAVERAGIRVLNNEKVERNGMQIVGVHDAETQNPEVFRALLQRAALDRHHPSILLAHQPTNLSIAEAEGVSLQVSGHTHGGQFWPWTWVAARVHGRFNHGLNRLGKMQVCTSYGVGTWGAPMRLGTGAEIVLIRLESAAS